MLSFEQFFFAMIRTQTAENIGSAARALKVMGFQPAHLISPECAPQDGRAHALASHAADTLPLMPQHSNLSAFRSQVDVLVGFSFKGDVFGPDCVSLPELLDEFKNSNPGRVGLLFGPENSGLSNDDLSYCHYSCYIPTPSHTNYHSLNLAQSVQVVAYALSQKIGFVAEQDLERPLTQTPFYSYDFLEKWLARTLAQPSFQAFTQRTTLDQTEKKARVMLQRLVRSQEDLDFLCGFIKACQKGATHDLS